MPQPRQFRDQVESLAKPRGLKFDNIAGLVAAHGVEGASRSKVVQAKVDPRALNREILELAATELGISPDDFAEWRPIVIADALRLEHGNLEQVLSNLQVIEHAPDAEHLSRLPAAPRRRVGGALPADQGGALREFADFSQQELDQDEREHPEAPDADEGSS